MFVKELLRNPSMPKLNVVAKGLFDLILKFCSTSRKGVVSTQMMGKMHEVYQVVKMDTFDL